MDTLLDSMPDRPLERNEVMGICDHDVVDWGAAPAETQDGNVYVFILVLEAESYVLGFDEEADAWTVIHSVPRSQRGAVDELNQEVSEWADELYPDRKDEIAPEFPSVV